MNRRDTVLALLALGAAPLAAQTQQAQGVRRIGFFSLDTSDSEAGRQAQKMFPEALGRLGYRERENIVIDWRWADGITANLPGLAADLVRSNLEVVVARTNASIRAAIEATRTIPIVMFNGNFPVENKFVESLAHPGGNVTGTSYLSAEMFEKQIQIIKELVPRTVRIAALLNANMRGTQLESVIRTSLNRAATALGIAVQYFEVRHPEEIGAALNMIAASGINAFWYSGDPIFRVRTAEIMAFLRDHKLASIATIPTFAEGGGLAHYAPDIRAFYDRTASYVDRILKGAQPADLPVEEPTKFELVINLKTAKALGVTIPQSILLRADRFIE